MKIIDIIRTVTLIFALITVFTTTAAALSCDCGDICVNTNGWWHVQREQHADTGGSR